MRQRPRTTAEGDVVKTCRDCLVERPLSDFPLHGHGPQGQKYHGPHCGACMRVRRRKTSAAYRVRHPEHRIYMKQYHRQWRDERRPELKQKRERLTPKTAGARVCTKCFQEFPATTEWFASRGKDSTKLIAVCRSCRAQETCTSNRARYKMRRAAGLCGGCNQPWIDSAYCPDCKINLKRATLARYDRLKQQHICVQCGRQATNQTSLWCEGCAIKQRLSAIATLQRLKRADPAAYSDKQYRSKKAHKARKVNAPKVERIYRTKIIKRDKSTCYICKQVVLASDIHLDHVIPLSRGGEHSYANIRVTCRPCNLKKHNKLPEELGIIVEPLR